MDGCSLLAIIACFHWSNVYVDGGLVYQDSQSPYQVWQTSTSRTPSGGIETVTQQVTTDDPFNPYGRLAIGYEVQLRSMSIALEATHISSLQADDRGINSINLRARWYPFRH